MLLRRHLLALAAAPGLAADTREILTRSVALDIENLRKLQGYVWTSDERSSRAGKQTRQQGFEINLVSGQMYWRLVELNGKPLDGQAKAAELARLKRHLTNPAPDNTWIEERRYIEALPPTHDAIYAGAERLNGRETHLITTRPKPGGSGLLDSIAFKLWIDAEDYHWARVEMDYLRGARWRFHQFTVGRLTLPYSNNIVNSGDLPAGSKTTIELQRLPEGIWALSRHHTDYGGKYANELRHFNFRRFASESQLIVD